MKLKGESGRDKNCCKDTAIWEVAQELDGISAEALGIPKGFSPPAPGLAFFSQPWGTAEPRDPTPTGLRQPPSGNMQNRHNPFQGCEFDFFSPQGWLKNANPGLED